MLSPTILEDFVNSTYDKRMSEKTMLKITQAVSRLEKGELVIFPTETVYGLGANATDPTAVAKIFTAKQRPHGNPLIVHCRSLESAQRFGVFSPLALTLAQHFWPGPLTLVLPKRTPCPIAPLVSSGLSTIALRVPAHPLAKALLQRLDFPLAAPSANRSGYLTSTTVAQTKISFDTSEIFNLDGGRSKMGLESTILEITSDKPLLLRPGAIPIEPLESLCAQQIENYTGVTIRAPGQLTQHYAPNCSLRLDALDPQAGEALLAFGDAIPPHKGVVLNLSPQGDLREAAANLFEMLHTLEASNCSQIAVMPIPHVGLGVAINDRLKRAAQG